MNLYLISQSINNDYDTYDSAVVAAENPDDARNINPSEYVTHIKNGSWMGTYSGGHYVGQEYEIDSSGWVRYADIDQVEVKYLGETTEPRGVILASFNAG